MSRMEVVFVFFNNKRILTELKLRRGEGYIETLDMRLLHFNTRCVFLAP